MQQLDGGDPVMINCATCPEAPLYNAVIPARYMYMLEDH